MSDAETARGRKIWRVVALLSVAIAFLAGLALFVVLSLGRARQRTTGSLTPLHTAAAAGNKKKVLRLLAEGADVNAMFDNYSTPLFEAARFRRMEIARILIAHGANVNPKPRLPSYPSPSYNCTPLQKASQNGDEEMVRLLIAHGADVNLGCPLWYALRADEIGIADVLLANGADVNGRETSGWTPLHGAAWEGNYQIAEFLVRRAADTDRETTDGYTPLALALEKGHNELAELLRQNGAKNQPQRRREAK